MEEEKTIIKLNILKYFTEHYRRQRTVLHYQLILSHNALLKNLAIKRKTNWNKVCALQNNTAAKFVIENGKYVRFYDGRGLKRSDESFQNLINPENEAEFFENFRMSEKTFELLTDKLRPFLKAERRIYLTEPGNVEKKLALCLYKLASGCSYIEVGKLFGVTRSTARKYFPAMIRTILNLKSEYLNFPTQEEAIAISQNFEEVLKFPNILGVIGDTHIPILSRRKKQATHMNSNGWQSFIMQAIVDHKSLFRSVYISHGNDNNVFQNSISFQPFFESFLTSIVSPDNNPLPLMLIGDCSFPLRTRLLKPYSECLNENEERFNSNLNTGLEIVQNAFKRLRARWQCFAREMEFEPDVVPTVIMACAILHNFLEQEKEKFSENWVQTFEKKYKFKEPTKIVNNEIIIEHSSDPEVLRELLKNDYS